MIVWLYGPHTWRRVSLRNARSRNDVRFLLVFVFRTTGKRCVFLWGRVAFTLAKLLCYGAPSTPHQQLPRILVHGVNVSNAAIDAVGDAVNQCEVCRAFDEAPNPPISGRPQDSAFLEKIQADPLSLGAVVAPHAMVPLCGDRVALAASWNAVFGKPGGIRMHVGGAWGNEVRVDFFSERQSVSFEKRGRVCGGWNIAMDWIA